MAEKKPRKNQEKNGEKQQKSNKKATKKLKIFRKKYKENTIQVSHNFGF